MTFDAAFIRAQFPSLNIPVEGKDGTLPVFFDNPAGTQVPQSVIDAVRDYYLHMNANHGGHFATSQRSDAAVDSVRAKVASFLGASRPEEIAFGQNMTTLNFALSRALASRVQPGDEIVVTRMDHDANVSPWLRLAADTGAEIKWVDLNEADCTLDMDSLEAALSEKTRIVATVHASNAVGTINPVARIADMVHAAGALHIVDAVQSAPHIPIDVQTIGCDFLLCSAYKFYGPHIGVMYGRYDLLTELPAYKVRPADDLPPGRWETGTLSFETINAVGAAVDHIASTAPQSASYQQAMAHIVQYERELVSKLIDDLSALPGLTIAGITDPARYDERVPTVAFRMDKHTPDAIARHLAANDIYVWSGHYYAIEIMKRIGRQDEGMVRVGLAHYNTSEEIDRLIGALKTL